MYFSNFFGDLKAPDCDGINAFFFKKCLATYGRGCHYCTVVIFLIRYYVSWLGNPSRVTKFKFNTCCTIWQKNIFKVLTIRMKKVINVLIDNNQLYFMPKRAIINNIVPTHELVKHYVKSGCSHDLWLNRHVEGLWFY